MSDYYNEINSVIDEIEKNLTNKIQYKELAKKLGTSEYAMQRIFSFITGGITLTEYIRKRRMCMAMEDLKTGAKVIDVALKYQYESPISFARAFQKIYHMPPSKAKKYNGEIEMFPKLLIGKKNLYKEELEYRIVPLEKQIFFGKDTGIMDCNDKESIARLWDVCANDGTLEYIKATSTSFCYGASIYTDIETLAKTKREDKMRYYIMGKENRKDFSKVVIPKADWVLFKVKSKKQQDILNMIQYIFLEWLPSSGYEFAYPYYNIEIYYENDCEYGIPIKQK